MKTNKRNIKEIILHCSATPEGEDYTAEQIRQWHLQRGFSDIGYHYVVYRDGSVHKGRDESQTGAHCKGHNSNSIGVCYIGGCAARSVRGWQNTGKDTRTSAQRSSLNRLIAELLRRYPSSTVHGHNEYAAKACPGFRVVWKSGVLAMLLACVLTLTGCRSKKKMVAMSPTVVERVDSTRHRIVEQLIYVADTVCVELPAQTASEVTYAGVSELETDFARSRAWINADGSLGHTLANKERTIEKEVYVPRYSRDSLIEKERIREVPVPYPVEKEGKARKEDFPVFLIIGLIGLIWLIWKIGKNKGK